MLSSTLRKALHDTLPVCLTLRCQVRSQNGLKHTPEYAQKCTSNCTGYHLPACLTIHSNVRSQDALKYSSKHAPNYTHQRQDTPNLTWLYDPMYAPGCSIQRLAELQAPRNGRSGAESRWQEVEGGSGRNHDISRYLSLNHIFSAATITRSHNASLS